MTNQEHDVIIADDRDFVFIPLEILLQNLPEKERIKFEEWLKEEDKEEYLEFKEWQKEFEEE